MSSSAKQQIEITAFAYNSRSSILYIKFSSAHTNPVEAHFANMVEIDKIIAK